MSTTQIPWLERLDLFLGLALIFHNDDLVCDNDEPVWYE